ncbi:peptide transporter family 1-like, partial [Contarinia nasturtii]|uniref:peptide transporter family 1-like n=1 Tax=Contarinia nasturtii TaxID=265458 RepID=UPI0012D41249
MDNSHKRVVNDANGSEAQKLPYPKRIFLIIGNEFCERFTFYGMSRILAIYMKNKLNFTENDAILLYHTFVMLTYFACIFGAILSDSWLGKFRTIFYLSIIYSIGSVIVSVGAIPMIGFSPKAALFIGLVLIAIGSGGIKPCVSAFGGDQFKLPEQAAQMATYFSLFYFSINVGVLFSTILTPIFRADVHCFGEHDCYSLAFGVPAILMIISIHKFGAQLVTDTRTMLKIFVLHLPLPIVSALFKQQGSSWTFQAVKMNGDIGFYNIKPDQVGVSNAILVLIFIPTFEATFYPILSKIGIRNKLQKVVLGSVFTCISFLLAALLEFWIETSPKNSVNILWQLPQYVVISMGEVMFQVTGLEFSYEQAPESMRSVVLSIWQLNVAIGNLIIVAISGMQFFQFQAYEFLFYAILLFFGMFIFAIMARNFKSTTTNNIKPIYIPLDTIE